MTAPLQTTTSAVDELVDSYRERCLWFLRSYYYPTTRAEQLRVLEYIERHGDLEAYRLARTLRQWLLQQSSETSVA